MLAYEKEIELDLSDSYAPNFLNKQLHRSTEDGWYDFVLKAPESGCRLAGSARRVRGTAPARQSPGRLFSGFCIACASRWP